MGISTDAMLVFGFPVGDKEEAPAWLGEDADFSAWLAEKLGIPDDDYPAQFLAEARCPADLVAHCSHDYPMYILAIRGTQKRATRGNPEDITLDSLVVAPELVSVFREWCEKYEIEYQEPKWILCSLMG